MKLSIIIFSLLILCNPAQAETLRVGYGRLSIIDLGSLINAKPLITDETLVKVYEVSGLDAENDKSIIVVQGLKDSGETDLTIDTQIGIKQFHLVLESGAGEDTVLNYRQSRSMLIPHVFSLGQKRSTIIQMPAHINEYVLVGNPNLINLKQIKDYYDRDFLKTFALNTNTSQGLTDLVVPTRRGVYKLTLDIGGINSEDLQHNSFIDFGDKLSASF